MLCKYMKRGFPVSFKNIIKYIQAWSPSPSDHNHMRGLCKCTHLNGAKIVPQEAYPIKFQSIVAYDHEALTSKRLPKKKKKITHKNPHKQKSSKGLVHLQQRPNPQPHQKLGFAQVVHWFLFQQPISLTLIRCLVIPMGFLVDT